MLNFYYDKTYYLLSSSSKPQKNKVQKDLKNNKKGVLIKNTSKAYLSHTVARA